MKAPKLVEIENSLKRVSASGTDHFKLLHMVTELVLREDLDGIVDEKQRQWLFDLHLELEMLEADIDANVGTRLMPQPKDIAERLQQFVSKHSEDGMWGGR